MPYVMEKMLPEDWNRVITDLLLYVQKNSSGYTYREILMYEWLDQENENEEMILEAMANHPERSDIRERNERFILSNRNWMRDTENDSYLLYGPQSFYLNGRSIYRNYSFFHQNALYWLSVDYCSYSFYHKDIERLSAKDLLAFHEAVQQAFRTVKNYPEVERKRFSAGLLLGTTSITYKTRTNRD